MKKTLYKYFFYISILLSSCITEYTPEIDNMSDILVVEGTITSGTTIIKLRRSVTLDENSQTSETMINDATVTIECDNGTSFIPDKIHNGEYHIPIGVLDPVLKYQLKILLDGKEYQSEFSNPIHTPEISELGWNKGKKDGESFASFYVSTEGEEDQPQYYMWSYNEIWEIKSPIYKNFIIVDKDKEGAMQITDAFLGESFYYLYCDEFFGPTNERLYCWVYNRSNEFLLASTEQTHENKITRHEIFQKSPIDRRFKELYYIKVIQNMISKEAFYYFSNLQKNIENTGSIFPPIPSEMKGNIRCITDPGIPVIGYVEVSNTKTKELFIRYEDGLAEFLNYDCELFDSPLVKDEEGNNIDPPATISSMGLAYIDPSGDKPLIFYAHRRCFDCIEAGGTKNKPDFWPNDHL